MLLLTDAHGRVIGVAAKDPAREGGHGIAITPLPGQTLHEVDVPTELADLLHGPDAHAVLSRFVVEPTGAALRKIPVTVHRVHD
jgi:hypothetical protein